MTYGSLKHGKRKRTLRGKMEFTDSAITIIGLTGDDF
jgi:hypothetical protein